MIYGDTIKVLSETGRDNWGRPIYCDPKTFLAKLNFKSIMIQNALGEYVNTTAQFATRKSVMDDVDDLLTSDLFIIEFGSEKRSPIRIDKAKPLGKDEYYFTVYI